MSVNTALLFSILGGGLLVWSWQTVRRENLNFLRWLPVTAAVTLMIMVTFVSLVNNRQLEIASYRLKHTVRVIFYTQSFEENLIDLQRGGLGQARPGDTNEFGSGQNGPNLEPEQFHRLLSLSSDNPGQEQLLKELAATMEQVFAHERRATALHPQPGFAATLESGPDAEGRKIFSRAHDILKAFSGEEQRSLDQGYVLEQAHAQSAARLLIFGSMLAAALLVAANYLVGREMNRRQRVEIEREKLIDELRRLLDEVKILSGMIPICGWCKSIRSDEGYWQTVEQYVREHTDATFTHGICPRCAEKLKAELHAASPSAVQ